jgi:DNA repair exonuclease SbcCD ATPase subunit
MDLRKKTIRDLETKKSEDLACANKILGELGEDLLIRLEIPDAPAPGPLCPEAPDGNSPEGLREEYKRLLKEIASSEDRIKGIEAENGRYQDLEKEISRKEEENSENVRKLSLLYVQLGQYILADPEFETFTLPFKDEMDNLLSKIDSQEAKLEELEQKEGNIFTWLGNNARTLVVKGMLSKNQSALHKVYRAAGERFIESGFSPEEGEIEIRNLAEKAISLKHESGGLAAEIASLRDEHKKLAGEFARLGHPVRRIQGLEKQIALARENIRELCVGFGVFAVDPAWRDYFAPFLKSDDRERSVRVDELRSSMRDAELQIEKLRAAMAIDSEKAEIEKLRKSIAGEKNKIEAARRAIAELESLIDASEKHIGELAKKL